MRTPSFWYKKILGIQYFELGLLCLLYLVFGLAYFLALYTTSNGYVGNWDNTILDYFLKGIFTLPIWWLVFKRLSDWKIWQKILLHILLLPLFVIVWQQTYYAICEALGWGHLEGSASYWDIYIPGLFYVIQFGIFHMYDYYQKLQQQQALEAELRELALKSELTALKAQLNPHFLYNTFNTISASLPPEQENTREMIAQLSDLFRYQLKASKTELVSLGEEIGFVRTYLQLEKARFGDRLQFEFLIPEKLLPTKVPPMILQPLVENAVKHGVAPKIDGGNITIKASKNNHNIQFEIEDTGVGLTEGADIFNKGIGLTNTQKRLEKMYGSILQVLENTFKGVTVRFEIPLGVEGKKTKD
jgi:two-component system LytT family sensor kinase